MPIRNAILHSFSGTVTFRFYEELNDFLPPGLRRRPFARAIASRASVKDMIEALGVPHTEIDLILVNGRSVDFSHIVSDGEYISVYPVFESFDISPLLRLRPQPLRITRFVLDTHLGRLARYLRMLGFDTLYRNDYGDDELARIAGAGRRILLTRDVGLLKRSIVTRGYYLRAAGPRRQLPEVVARFDLYRAIRPFRRCLRCNGELSVVAAAKLGGRVDQRILERHDRFCVCRDCGRIYWQGSHYARMLEHIRALLREDPAAASER